MEVMRGKLEGGGGFIGSTVVSRLRNPGNSAKHIYWPWDSTVVPSME